MGQKLEGAWNNTPAHNMRVTETAVTYMHVLAYDPTFYDTLVPSCMSICMELGYMYCNCACAFASFIVIFFSSNFMLSVTSGCMCAGHVCFSYDPKCCVVVTGRL